MELKVFVYFCLLIISFLTSVKSLPQALRMKQRVDTTSKQDAVKRKDRVYLFGVGGSRKPYNYENDDGKLAGFDVDIINVVCAVAKKDCFTVLTRKQDCIFTDRNIDYAGEGLMSQAVDGCAGYQITTDRQNEFTFTGPYLKGKSTYAVSPSNPRKFDPSQKDFSKFRLVHASGSPFNAACLNRQGKTFGPILVTATVAEAKETLTNGTADVLLSTRVTIDGLDVLPAVVSCDDGRGTGLLLKKGSSVPVWWNPAFRKLYKSKAYFKLCIEAGKRYNASINCLPHSDEAEVKLFDAVDHERTNNIQADSSRLWKFVVSGRIAPYSFINKNGELVGFTKDFILNVCRIAKKKCVLLLSEVNECTVRIGELLYPGRGLISGWFDACTGYFSTVDRRNSWDFTDAYLVSNASFYVAPGNPKKFNPDLHDLSSFRIVYQATAITNDHCLHRLHKTIGKLIVVDDENQAAMAVLSGKADAWFTKLIADNSQGMVRLPQRYHCENVGSSVMVRKGSDLPTWWNKAFHHFVVSGEFHRFCETQGKLYHNNFPCIPAPSKEELRSEH